MNPLLQVRDLHVHFDTPQGAVRANAGVSLDVCEGQSIGIMGESGCGKTVLFLSILRLQQPGRIVSGSVSFDGKDITLLAESDVERIRGREIALVPQNHATALNPAYTVRDQLAEAIAWLLSLESTECHLTVGVSTRSAASSATLALRTSDYSLACCRAIHMNCPAACGNAC